jgi:phospholipase/carboxylesterase
MKSNLPRIQIGDWQIRYRLPAGPGPHPVVWLLHGWKGDQDSMWVFAHQIPENFLVLAPRAIYPEPSGGFSWYPLREPGWPTWDVFAPAVFELYNLMENWPATAPWGDFSQLRLAGFSQGAALAYAFALQFPKRVAAVAGLAGFLPTDAELTSDPEALARIKVYIAHGTKDHIVPIELARETAQKLEAVGAEVTFCESNVRHKLGADCFEGLAAFFQDAA